LSILPGWDSVETTKTWSNGFHIAGFVTLFMLAVFEVLAFIYSEHKDTLSATHNVRSLDNTQQQRIAFKLSSFKEQSAEIKVSPLTTEGAGLANQLNRALTLAHWTSFLHPPGAPFSTGSFSTSGSFANGVVVWPTREQRSIDAAEALAKALTEEGVLTHNLGPSTGVPNPNPTFAPGCEAMEESKRSDPYCFRVLIIVGDRPGQ
jgi:hypothetical protein